MAYLLHLPSCSDERGNLTVLDNLDNNLPFEVKRIFYIHGANGIPRAGHRHYETEEAVICVHGRCTISYDNGLRQGEFLLNDPSQCLIIKAEDWRSLYHFSHDAVLLVFASTVFDKSDYIYEPYTSRTYSSRV